jgi:hypothetical protein
MKKFLQALTLAVVVLGAGGAVLVATGAAPAPSPSVSGPCQICRNFCARNPGAPCNCAPYCP